MPTYSFIVWTKHRRVKYPDSFYLPDVEAAHEVAKRIAQVFGEVIPQWGRLSYDRQNNFAVEVIEETGHTLLTVPCKKAEEVIPQRDWATRLLNMKTPPGWLN